MNELEFLESHTGLIGDRVDELDNSTEINFSLRIIQGKDPSKRISFGSPFVGDLALKIEVFLDNSRISLTFKGYPCNSLENLTKGLNGLSVSLQESLHEIRKGSKPVDEANQSNLLEIFRYIGGIRKLLARDFPIQTKEAS